MMSSSSSSSQPNDNEDLSLNHITPVRTIMTLSESQTQVYLSLIWQGGQLGVAYYNLDTTEIYMMMDTAESDRFITLQSIINQISPTCMLISSKQDERLTKYLKSIVQKHVGSNNEDENTSDNDIIHILPGVDFSFEVCKRRLLSTELPSMPKHFLENERTLYLSSLIPFENVCMVRAAGSLLKYLEKNRIGIELEADHVKVPILSIKIFSLKDQIVIDNTTLSALQIFQKESHPSVYKSGLNSSKEGLSLFGILNRCKSQIGSKLLRNWFLRPLRDLTILQQRHDAIAYLMNGRHIEIVHNLEGCLRQIRNVSRILSRMIQSQASVADWQALYKTVYHAIYIGDICRAQNQNIAIFSKISKTFTEDLQRIASLISKIIDFDESALQNKFVVKHNVDPELDEKKRTYNGLPNFMTQVAKEELKNLDDDITECNVIYLPQLGYLVAIPRSERMKNEEDFKIPGLDFVFLSNDMVHYKSAYTRNLDRILGDTQCDITDHETSIMHRLQDTVLEHSAVLSHVMEHTAELDCLLAFAQCAREFGYVQPILNQDNRIEIKSGRHPLQEIVCSPFVPNDTFSGGSYSKIMILTSPNASGKSVYLKQVALIVYMACIGSFIPAESPSTICPVDRIFTRIKSQESVSVGLSTFMLDINQMSDALRNATRKSLVIIDEFGKGTETVDGLSLFAASLRYWIALNEKCPHVFVSTHFHSIIQYDLLPKSQVVTYQTMETMHNGEELVFLFQLTKGFTKSSFANETALQAGLPPEIVKRGVEISNLIQENQPIHRVDSASTEQQLKRCHYLVNQFLDVNLETADLQVFLTDIAKSFSKGWQ